VSDFFPSPINGLYGIEDAESGVVNPDASGALFGGYDRMVAAAVIIAGAGVGGRSRSGSLRASPTCRSATGSFCGW
jgi:hypothetical protein